MTITAKFAGQCSICGRKINAGDKIEWKKGAGSSHTACQGKQPVPMNSLVPAQMIPGDADLAPLAAKHGRTIAGEPKLRSMMTSAARVGDIIPQRRKDGSVGRLLVLAVGPSRYYSRDFLEDMDMFSMRPGRYSDAQAVAVEPTAEEAAAEAAAQAKAPGIKA
jgi:hypothetical protein